MVEQLAASIIEGGGKMKQLLILSGKGGTGKTTVASAFVKLAQAWHRLALMRIVM